MVKQRINQKYQKVSQMEIEEYLNYDKLNKEHLQYSKYLTFILKYSNIITFVFFIISVALYKESLRGCFESQAECLKNLNEGEIRSLITMLNYCGFIIALTITGCIFKYIHKFFIFIIAIVYGYLCLIYDVGYELNYHGAYNRLVLAVLFSLWLIALNLFIIVIRGLKKNTYVTSIVLTLVLFSCFAVYRHKVNNSCQDWDKGLNDVRMSTTNMPCKMARPEECYIDVFDGLFDYTYWFGHDCEKIRSGDRILYDKYLLKNNPNYKQTNRIGFPRTEDYSYDESKHIVINYKVLNELIDMNDPNVPESIKNKTEVVIDYSGEESKVLINIAKNYTMLKNKANLYKKFGSQLLSKNLLIVYIDALSRRHFMRKMKKTAAWINKFYKTGHPKYTSYQFMKYHSIGYFTAINTVPAFFGKWMFSLGGNYYTKYWKDKGAVTSKANSFCGRQVFDVENDDYRYLNFEKYEHENIALFCDPNYYQADCPYTPFLGPNSVKRRCLHGKDVHDYLIEYGTKFWDAYPEIPKVMRLDFIDAHEGSLEIDSYLDDKL
jgi:hypothetical protein